MKTLRNLLPLDILVLSESRIGAFRLRLGNNLKTSRGYGRIDHVISNPIHEMGNDYMKPQYSFEKPFRILKERNDRRTVLYIDSLIL